MALAGCEPPAALPQAQPRANAAAPAVTAAPAPTQTGPKISPFGDEDNDGIANRDDACPVIAGAASADPNRNGCPSPPDKDADGVADGEDDCPESAAAANLDTDRNGCVDDMDGDGVANAEDSCPRDRGAAADAGCPKHVRTTASGILLITPIYFQTGKPSLHPSSAEVLDEIANALAAHPEIQLLEIQGHYKSSGYGMNLSQRRADSVKKALIERGIPASRLTAKGYGDTKPIYSAAYEEGRRKNLRIELRILRNVRTFEF